MQNDLELTKNSIERKIISIETVELDDNIYKYDTLITKVKVRDGFFYEYYVGVPKEDYFNLNIRYLPERSELYKFITKKAFTDFGCKKYIHFKEAKSPLDGAWLSFARPGIEYYFLNDDYFYYGGGFLIYDQIPYLNDEKCYISAHTQLRRIFDFLKEYQNIDIKKPYLPSLLKIEQDIRTNYLYNTDLYIYRDYNISRFNLSTLIKNSHEISKLIKIFLLDDFDHKNQSNIYNILNSSNFRILNLNNTSKLELKYSKIEDGCYVMEEDYISQFIINLMKTKSIETELNTQIRFFINEYLQPTHYNYIYWHKLLNKSLIQKLNKHEAKNLADLFSYLIKEKNRKWVFKDLKLKD